MLTKNNLPFFRFSRAQGGPDSRPQGSSRDTGGEVVKRPSILKQDDLKELDELDHDGDEGWAGKKINKKLSLKYTTNGNLVGYREPVLLWSKIQMFRQEWSLIRSWAIDFTVQENMAK